MVRNIQFHTKAKTEQIEYVVTNVSGICKLKKLSIHRYLIDW